jgi:2-keto-4-pentenoate hydratase/2-oxohepta-3-ene-1,7-dioic acid hydratase in catechol pathway
MKLTTFTHDDSTRIGVLGPDGIVDLSAAAPSLPGAMIAFLEAGPEALERAAEAVESAHSAVVLDPDDVTTEAPILRPPKILAVGLNYADHVAETGRPKPEIPMIFNKQPTSVCRPGGPIHVPRASDKVDWEGELAFVVGKRCRHVPRDEAAGVIAGFTIVHDVSVRDWQHRSPTFTMGKSFDTHCPMGPVIVTADEIGDPHSLDIRTWVNGELRQSSNTRELIFDCFTLVEHLSTAFTLEPGDVISTGTPSGVGAAMDPPVWLKAGDTVRIAVDKIGELENPVIEEPADTILY